MTAVALALAASVCWGVGDFLGGLSARRLATLAVLAVSQVAGLAAIAVVVAVAGDAPPSATALLAAAAAGIAGAIGLGALYRGMAAGAIAVVAPISSAAAVIPVAVGLARGERPSPLQLAGMGGVLAGVALASRERGELGTRVAAGVGLALVAAAGFGAYFVLIDAAADEDALWAVLVARTASSAATLAAAAALGRLAVGRRDLPVLAAIGVFDVGANALLALALTHGLVSVVAVLASLYPVVTVALAVAVLRERPARAQALGIAVALAGVALISGG